MKIAYIVSHNFSNNEGVTKKIIEQIRAWQYYGAKVTLYSLGKKEDDFKAPTDINFFHCRLDNFIENRLLPNKKLLDHIISFNPDLVYIRYDLWRLTYDILFKKFKTIIEIQTNDIEEFKLFSGFKNKISYIYFKFFRNRFLSNASAYITVTKELSTVSEYTKYNKPMIYIPNGIDLKNYEVIKKENNNKGRKKLFFIGTGKYPWHGVDLIEKLANCLPEFEFHIVGDYNKSEKNNIKYYGVLTKEGYIKVLENCHVCIGTLALHRKKMNEACPLKVREYLAHGFPVIIGYKDTAFLEKRSDFICQIDFSDEQITDRKISVIKDFIEKKYNRIVLHKEIEHIDTLNLEKRRLEFMSSLIKDMQSKIL